MHPEIAKRLIQKYIKKSSDIVFDPFMGSGGVLVESMLHGNNSVGIDLNPFAVLLTTVKTTPLDAAKLETTFNQIILDSKKDKKNKIEPDNAPNFLPKKPKEKSLKFWYQNDTLRDLQILKNHVFLIKDEKTRDFFKICFSLATRKVSFQKNSIYKIYRMKPDKRKLFKPNVLDEFSKICKNNIKNMNEFSNTLGINYSKATPILGNTFAAPELLDGKKPTLVVTSPPYGDHGTTVAYGQFSRHPGMWLELEDSDELFAVDSNGLGGQKKKTIEDLHSETLDKTLKKIKEKDSQVPKEKTHANRTADVYSFFYDLDKCFDKISQVLKPKQSHCCFVVANRTVRREKIPTDVICVELAKKYGFKYVDTIYRTIANKAMSLKNAPENIVNFSGNTMTKESIVIWEY
jgi:DNA modification methylase